MNKTFSFGNAFAKGWEVFKEHWQFFLGSTVLIFFVSGFFGYLADGPYRGIEPTSGILSLIGGLLRVWLNFNLLVITVRILDGEKPAWGDLFLWRPETLPYVGASILYGVIILLGLIAFIIPGVYFAIKYGFYGFLIADKKVGAFDSLKLSGQMMVGVKWLMIGFTLASMGIILLGLLSFGVGLLIALPVVSVAFIVVYRSLYDQTFNAVPAPVTETPVVVAAPAEPKVAEVTETKTTEAVVTPAVEKPVEKAPEKTETPKSDTPPATPAL